MATPRLVECQGISPFGARSEGRRWRTCSRFRTLRPSPRGGAVRSEIRDMLQSSLGTGYRLSRELGGGGMAKTFVADDDAGRRVVLKVLPPDLAAGVNIERF